jgi:RNA polymerase-binding transcription factor DksA
MIAATARAMWTRGEIRTQLLRQRADLLIRYHDAVARADDQYELVEGAETDVDAERWYEAVVSTLTAADLWALGEIIVALDRLDDGDYGSCMRCGGPIDGDWHAHHVYATACPGCAAS